MESEVYSVFWRRQSRNGGIGFCVEKVSLHITWRLIGISGLMKMKILVLVMVVVVSVIFSCCCVSCCFGTFYVASVNYLKENHVFTFSGPADFDLGGMDFSVWMFYAYIPYLYPYILFCLLDLVLICRNSEILVVLGLVLVVMNLMTVMMMVSTFWVPSHSFLWEVEVVITYKVPVPSSFLASISTAFSSYL